MVSGRLARSKKSGPVGPERLQNLIYQFDKELSREMGGFR
jgi:hypothetical protein